MSALLLNADAHEVREGACLYRALDDGRELAVYRMLPGQFRLTIGDQGDGGYDNGWCFHAANLPDLIVLVAEWDGAGDPPGPWYRDLETGRRREFDAEGNVVREFVRR